jgi:hypothetical protein
MPSLRQECQREVLSLQKLEKSFRSSTRPRFRSGSQRATQDCQSLHRPAQHHRQARPRPANLASSKVLRCVGPCRASPGAPTLAECRGLLGRRASRWPPSLASGQLGLTIFDWQFGSVKGRECSLLVQKCSYALSHGVKGAGLAFVVYEDRSEEAPAVIDEQFAPGVHNGAPGAPRRRNSGRSG